MTLPVHQDIDTSTLDKQEFNPIIDYMLYTLAVSVMFMELHIIYKVLHESTF